MFPHDLKQTPAFISVLLTRRAKKYKNKTDGKIESVYVNRQLSVFPCWSRKWTQTWSTGIPVSPSSPTCPLLWGPHHDGRSPGRELHCVCDVNFLFYRGSWVCLYGSVRILLWETMTRKWYFSWFFFLFSGKQSSMFLGSRILSVKHLNSLLKVHQLNLSQTLRRIAVCYSRQQKHAEHYKTQMFSFTLLIKWRPHWLDGRGR